MDEHQGLMTLHVLGSFQSGHLDEAQAALGVVLDAQLIELLQDVLRRLVALDHAALVKQHHVACAPAQPNHHSGEVPP